MLNLYVNIMETTTERATAEVEEMHAKGGRNAPGSWRLHAVERQRGFSCRRWRLLAVERERETEREGFAHRRCQIQIRRLRGRRCWGRRRWWSLLAVAGKDDEAAAETIGIRRLLEKATWHRRLDEFGDCWRHGAGSEETEWR